jgi:hypothetical protein
MTPSSNWNYYGRWAAVLVAAIFFGQYILKPSSYTLIDFANLALHEGGHILFSFFGEFITFLGGSLWQILMPICFVLVFRSKKQTFSAALTLFWVSNNFFNVSNYAGDARAQTLELVGGGIHDWNWMLERLGWLERDGLVAGVLYTFGLLCYLAALLWCISVIVQEQTPTEPSSSGPRV